MLRLFLRNALLNQGAVEKEAWEWRAQREASCCSPTFLLTGVREKWVFIGHGR